MYVTEDLWRELPGGTAGFGRYALVKPQRIMWETPVSAPMSVTGSDRAAWAGFRGAEEEDKAVSGVVLGLLLGATLVVGIAAVGFKG